MNLLPVFALVIVMLNSCSTLAPKNSLPIISSDFVRIDTFESVKTDIRYASTNNFVGLNMYGDFKTPYLHKDAAQKFTKAVELLKKQKPGWSFVIFDALRPRSIQRVLWAKVVNTPQQNYVADPDKGSVHNYGFALDLSLVDAQGREVDMGTPYDSFEKKAEPQHEQEFLKKGELTPQQIQNRLILRQIMQNAGFSQLPHEWWHFDALSRTEIHKNGFLIVE